MKQLHKFTEEEHSKLKLSGMMWEIYPEATGDYRVDSKPPFKVVTINHAGCMEVEVWLQNDGTYAVAEDDMERIGMAVGCFDVMILAHIIDRLQEANNE